MPEHIPSHQNNDNTEVHTDIKWIGDESLFKIGDRDIKLWHVIVGLILLSIFMPMFRSGKNGK
jgi:hypothetical protein